MVFSYFDDMLFTAALYLRNMRVIQIPRFRAVSSGEKTLEEIFSEGGFDRWCAEHPQLIRQGLYEPNSFLWHTGERETWGMGLNVLIYPVREGVTEEDVAPYEIMEFPGGIYLVATADENDADDINETVSDMMKWISESTVFEYGDFPQSGMCNMPDGNGAVDQALGVSQQQIFLPLKRRS